MKLRTRLVLLDSRTSVDYRNAGDAAHDLLAAHAYKQAVKQVLGYYPESAFPEDGESLDCKSASMARHTCNNIEQRAAEILAGWLGEERG